MKKTLEAQAAEVGVEFFENLPNAGVPGLWAVLDPSIECAMAIAAALNAQHLLAHHARKESTTSPMGSSPRTGDHLIEQPSKVAA